MQSHESDFTKFTDQIKEQFIVCFGAGKCLEQHKTFLEKERLCERIIAVIDNDEKKQGSSVIIAGKKFPVQSFDELAAMRNSNNFLVLVMSSYFQEIQSQIKACPQLSDVEILDARYVFQKRENYLASYSNLFEKISADVGENGQNMTISVLMYNRAELTNRLIDSIRTHMPEFAGEVLIGDNGSEESEYSILNHKLKDACFSWRIIKLGRHYPIPIGKNRLNMECRTDWILQLDNDMYFTGNPIRKINVDINKLGCPIWGLPYYDTTIRRVANYGSNLEFIFDKKGVRKLTHLQDMPFDESKKEWEPMLCTYIAGGASLMKKNFFEEMGGYDENIYINEDIELVYRINRKGFKIGNIGMKCLVHEHKKIDTELGRQYEAVRFAEERIKESKKYLKDKFGFEFV